MFRPVGLHFYLEQTSERALQACNLNKTLPKGEINMSKQHKKYARGRRWIKKYLTLCILVDRYIRKKHFGAENERKKWDTNGEMQH